MTHQSTGSDVNDTNQLSMMLTVIVTARTQQSTSSDDNDDDDTAISWHRGWHNNQPAATMTQQSTGSDDDKTINRQRP
jgi:hypothetical protein